MSIEIQELIIRITVVAGAAHGHQQPDAADLDAALRRIKQELQEQYRDEIAARLRSGAER